jgi:hypothetical protein
MQETNNTRQSKRFGYVDIGLFYGSLALSLVFIFSSYGNFSLDGPSHIYNAKLLQYLLSGNKFISTYFKLNRVPVPNLLDHFLLALLYFIMPVFMAQKVLLSICVVGMATGFRAIVKYYNPGNTMLSAFVIPLTQSFLFYIGFYNFCLSIACLLWAYHYFIKHFSNINNARSITRVIVMIVLLILNYFANELSFLFLGLLFLLHEMKLIVQSKKIEAKRILFLILTWTPAVLCAISFTLWVDPGHQQNGPRPFKELLAWLYNARILEVFSDKELLWTRIYFIVLIAILVCVLIKARTNTKGNQKIFLWGALFSLVLYFVLPDGFSVGMMSIRLSFYFFLFFTLWLATKNISALVKWPVTIVLYSCCWVLFSMHLSPLKQYDARVKEIVEASGKYIDSNSIVLPVDCENSWITIHMADYMGINKPIVNLEDYEATLDWFPVVANESAMPYVTFGIDNSSQWLYWFNGFNSKTRKQLDYVFIFGDFNKVMTQAELANIKYDIQTRCTLVYQSTDSWIHIYKNKPTL